MSGALRHKRHAQTAGKGRGALHLEDHTVAIHTPKPPPPTTSKLVPSSFAPAPITPRPPLLAPYGSEELVLLDDEALRREERRHRAIQEEMLSKPFGPNTTGVSNVEPITPRPPRAAHNANMAARSSTAPQKRSASNQDQIAAQEEQELAALKRKLFNQLSSTASVPVPLAFATPDRGSTTTPCDVVVSVTEASPLHSGKKVSPSPASPSPKRGSYRTQATLKPLPSAFGGCSLHVGGINITTTIQAAVEKRERGTVLSDVLGKEQNSSIDEEKSSEAKPGKAVTIQKSHNAAVAASFTSNLLLEALTRYETTHKQTASGIEKEKEEEGDDAATVRKTVQPVPCSEVSKDTPLLLPHGSLVSSLSGHTPSLQHSVGAELQERSLHLLNLRAHNTVMCTHVHNRSATEELRLMYHRKHLQGVVSRSVDHAAHRAPPKRSIGLMGKIVATSAEPSSSTSAEPRSSTFAAVAPSQLMSSVDKLINFRRETSAFLAVRTHHAPDQTVYCLSAKLGEALLKKATQRAKFATLTTGSGMPQYPLPCTTTIVNAVEEGCTFDKDAVETFWTTQQRAEHGSRTALQRGLNKDITRGLAGLSGLHVENGTATTIDHMRHQRINDHRVPVANRNTNDIQSRGELMVSVLNLRDQMVLGALSTIRRKEAESMKNVSQSVEATAS